MRKKISAAFAGTVAEHAYVTTYCSSERSHRAYCPSKSWLTRTNATGRNDLQTAKTLIPRKKSCSRYATIDDFSCTETQADGSLAAAFRKTFFLFEMSRSNGNKTTTTKISGTTSPGLLFFLFILFISFILLIEFIYFIYLVN